PRATPAGFSAYEARFDFRRMRAAPPTPASAVANSTNVEGSGAAAIPTVKPCQSSAGSVSRLRSVKVPSNRIVPLNSKPVSELPTCSTGGVPQPKKAPVQGRSLVERIVKEWSNVYVTPKPG